MTIAPKVRGGIVGGIGYLLSPLSWWNDLVVNLPLAYGFAWVLSLISERLFLPSLVLGYWMTNVIGLILLHKGITQLVSRDGEKKYSTRKRWISMILFSLAYTALVVLLVLGGILQPPQRYLE